MRDGAICAEAQQIRQAAGHQDALAEQEVRLLSGGNQQKVVIAKWLVRDCDILFFDEPTRGIDVGAKAEIYKLLRELADQGKAIVMISSELPEILRMSDRIVVMCEGRITGELTPEDATQEGSWNWRRNARQWRLEAMNNPVIAPSSERAAASRTRSERTRRQAVCSAPRRCRSCWPSRA